MRIGLLIDALARLGIELGRPHVDRQARVLQGGEQLVHPRQGADPRQRRGHVVTVDDVLVRRDGEDIGDGAGAQPVARAQNRRAPVCQRFVGHRFGVGVVLDRLVVAVEEPATLALDDRRRRRHAQPEQAALAIPAHQQRSKPEVIVEPGCGGGRQRGQRRRRSVDAGNRRELAVLGARIGAVDAGQVRRQRQRNHDDEQDHEQTALHQNRK